MIPKKVMIKILRHPSNKIFHIIVEYLHDVLYNVYIYISLKSFIIIVRIN